MFKTVNRLLFTLLAFFSGTIFLFAQPFVAGGPSGILPLYGGNSYWADLNNDGLIDLLLTGQDEFGLARIKVYRNQGDGSFLDISSLPDLENPQIAFIDANKDGFQDIFLSGTNDEGLRVSTLYHNQAGSGFVIAHQFTPLVNGAVVVGDFTNEGSPQILYTGLNALGVRETRLASKAASWTETVLSLPGLSNGSLLALDIQQNGKLDVIMSGINNVGQRIFRMYENLGGASFAQITASNFPGIAFSRIATTDIDQDGLPDLLVQGRQANGTNVSRLYRNIGTGFLQVSLPIENLSRGDIQFVDFNNDGLLDIAMAGIDPDNEYQTYLLENKGSLVFESISHALPPVGEGGIFPIDIQNNGKQDFFIYGLSDAVPGESILASLYFNQVASDNSPPASPDGLIAEVRQDSVFFSWQAPVDDLTPAEAISYRLYVEKDGQVFSLPPASLADGNARVLKPGFTYATNGFLRGLKEGAYQFRVQAVDHHLRSSGFSAPVSFLICEELDIVLAYEVCFAETLSLDYSDLPGTVEWFDTDGVKLQDGPIYDFVANSSRSLVLKNTSPVGCEKFDTLNITVLDLPEVFSPKTTTVCVGDTIDLQLPAHISSARWESKMQGLLAENAHSFSFVANQADTLVLHLTDLQGCENTDTLVVIVEEAPLFEIQSMGFYCFGESVEIELLLLEGNIDSVSWYNLSGTISGHDPAGIQFVANRTDTLVVDVFSALGCLRTDSVLIDVRPLPTLSLPVNIALCFGDTLSFDLTESQLNMEWSYAGQVISSTSMLQFVPQASDTLKVTFSNANACADSVFIPVTVNPLPVVSIGGDRTICVGDELFLEAGTGWSNVQWFSSQNGLLPDDSWFISLFPEISDTIWVEVTNENGCIQRDTIQVTVHPLPDFQIADNFSICLGDTLDFNLSGNFEAVRWESLSSGDTLSLDPDFIFAFQQSDSIKLFLRTENSCLAEKIVFVEVLTPVQADLGPDLTSCFGDSITLQIPAHEWQSVVWKNEAGDILARDTIFFAFQGQLSASYIVEAIDRQGCPVADTIAVEVLPLPELRIADEFLVCLGDELVLEAEGDFDLLIWRMPGGDSLTGAQQSLIVQESMTLELEAISAGGCSSFQEIRILPIALPEARTGSSMVLCENQEISLGADYTDEELESWTFSWSPAAFLDDANSPRPLVQLKESTWFYLSVENASGCQARDSVFIQVSPAPSLIFPEQLTICFGESVEIGYRENASYPLPLRFQWDTDPGLDRYDRSFALASPQESTWYTLKAFLGDCRVDSARVLVEVLPLPDIRHTADTTIGSGALVQLFASGGISYSWTPSRGLSNPRSATPIASPLVTTTYEVEVIDEKGCVDTREVTVFVRNTIFIPDLFTPNGDGNNDALLVYGYGFESLTLQIYNKQGQLIYESSDIAEIQEQGWDGTYRGSPLPSDVYVWNIQGRFFDGSPVQYEGKTKGVVKLIR